MSVSQDSLARGQKGLRLHLPPPQVSALVALVNVLIPLDTPIAAAIRLAYQQPSGHRKPLLDRLIGPVLTEYLQADRARPEQKALCDDTIVAGKPNSCRIFSKSDDIGCGAASSVSLCLRWRFRGDRVEERSDHAGGDARGDGQAARDNQEPGCRIGPAGGLVTANRAPLERLR